jgi:hypothetical protein
MGGTRNMHERNGKYIQNSNRRTRRKRTLGKPKHRWEVINNGSYRKGCQDETWVVLDQSKFQCRILASFLT